MLGLLGVYRGGGGYRWGMKEKMETSLCVDLCSNSLLMDVARTRMAADSKHDYLHVNSVELVIAARFGFRALRLNTMTAAVTLCNFPMCT